MKETNHQKIDPLPGAVTRWSHGPSGGLNGFLQSCRDNFGWKVQVSSQKFNAVIGKVPVVMHPGKGLPHVLFRLKALHQFNNLQIRHINFGVLREIVVLFGIAHSL